MSQKPPESSVTPPFRTLPPKYAVFFLAGYLSKHAARLAGYESKPSHHGRKVRKYALEEKGRDRFRRRDEISENIDGLDEQIRQAKQKLDELKERRKNLELRLVALDAVDFYEQNREQLEAEYEAFQEKKNGN